MGITPIQAHFPLGAPSEEQFKQHLKEAYGHSNGFEFYAEGKGIHIELALTFLGCYIQNMYIERVLMDLGGVVRYIPQEIPREFMFPAFVEVPWQSIPMKQRMFISFCEHHSFFETAIFADSAPEEESFREELTRRWGHDKSLVYYKSHENQLTLAVHGESALIEYIYAILYERGEARISPYAGTPYPLRPPAKYTDTPWTSFTSWQQWKIRIRCKFRSLFPLETVET